LAWVVVKYLVVKLGGSLRWRRRSTEGGVLEMMATMVVVVGLTCPGVETDFTAVGRIALLEWHP